MDKAHRDLEITKADFNALVEVLQVSMRAKGIPFSAQNRMLALLAPMHRQIVNAD
jgi:hemoglobin